jgi:nitrogen fixation protein FixH
MMKKLHAGHYIAIFFVFFISFLITALVASRRQNHNMVSEKYYDLDLHYQQRMNAKNNIAANTEKIILTLKPGEENAFLTIIDREANPVGTVKLYRPSDNKKDTQLNLTLDSNGKMLIPVGKLDKGRWIIIVDWKENETPYYKEFNIFL